MMVFNTTGMEASPSILELPLEILYYLFQNINLASSFAALGKTCKTLHDISLDPIIKEQAIKRMKVLKIKLDYNGQIKEEYYTLPNGIRHGTSKVYDFRGKVSETGYYIHGVKHGEFCTYFTDGKLRSKINYKNGKKDGELLWWYKNGVLYLRELYEEDILVRANNS